MTDSPVPPRVSGVAAGNCGRYSPEAKLPSAASPTSANSSFTGFFLWHFQSVAHSKKLNVKQA
jgi:hypothetical protein